MGLFEKLKALSEQSQPTRPEFIIAGLGNPGVAYENTRHNAGFLAIDALEKKYSFTPNEHKFNAVCNRAVIGGKSCLIMRPQTFMNKSGEAVSDAMDFYEIDPENIIVIYDDISLDVGAMRIRRKGSAGGHNGMKSIIALCGTQDFPRVKIGIGAKPHPDYDLADWVLSRFSDEDMKKLSEVFNHTAEAVELIIKGETGEAMNRFN
ncbi:MAG: aminoacyl-tRNA hydrolase [Ruminococcus sp.]|nr:aminoacyl-tRNA hydrolase [Ruminococcus sp.]